MLYRRIFLGTLPLMKCSLQKMSTESSEVIFRTINNKGVIVLNRPKKLNAITRSMLEKITQQFKIWDGKVNLVVVKGTGNKAFSVGGDIGDLAGKAKRKNHTSFTGQVMDYRLAALIHLLKVPYVSLLNGIVMGAGVGLSLNGSYRVATENAVFAMPENAVGLVPDGGVTYYFPRMNNNFGYFLSLTGTRLRGMDLFHAGSATHTCDSKRLPELEDELLQLDMHELHKSEISSFVAVNKILSKYTQETEFGKEQPFAFDSKMEKISYAFGAETVEEIMERLKEDQSEWARETLKVLKSLCPLSLKINLRQLREGRNKSLLEGLALEHRLCNRLCNEYNFSEGVRAAIIDKDKNPEWQPARLEDVSDEMVESYFQPLPEGQEFTLE